MQVTQKVFSKYVFNNRTSLNVSDNKQVRICPIQRRWETSFFWVFSYKEMMPGCYPEKDKDVIMGLTWDPEGELELPGQSWNQIPTGRMKSETCSGMWLNLTVRPDRPDDSSDDPIILQPPSAMTSLSLHPWCRIPACCPVTPSCADVAGMCPRSWGDTHIKI